MADAFRDERGGSLPRSGAGTAIVWLQASRAKPLELRLLAPAGSGPDKRDVKPADPWTLSVDKIVRTRTHLAFRISSGLASGDGAIALEGFAADGSKLDEATVLVGDFRKHPGMEIDLVAEAVKAGTASQIAQLQQLLFDVEQQVFNQLSAANVAEFGKWGCGKVVKKSVLQVFGTNRLSRIDYEHPYHEPMSGRVASRDEVKYRSAVLDAARGAIVANLKAGRPARVGVLDDPVGMTPMNGRLIAYFAGGHTTLIVGCDKPGERFLYIDPWPGGSSMVYGGGFASHPFTAKSGFLGEFESVSSAARRAPPPPPRRGLAPPPPDAGKNLIVQTAGSEGTFGRAGGNYLEIVSGPPIARPR